MIIKRLAFLLLLVQIACQHAYADIAPLPLPLPKIIIKAKTIIVARVEKYVPDLRYRNKWTSALEAEFGVLKKPGLYTFQVLRVLKGSCESRLQLGLPELDPFTYNSPKLQVEEGNMVLVFLQDQQGRWEPVDPTTPLVRLADDTALTTDAATFSNIESRIVDLLLASIANPILRQSNTFILKDVVHPKIPAALAPYMDDPDVFTQYGVLYCMATNQQISAIPRIAKQAAKVLKQKEGTAAALALEKYKTPKAIPFINPLLFDPIEYTRLAAAYTLRTLADRTSIPYLMMALYDPHLSVAYDAYYTLHRLIPVLGPPKEVPYFEKHREAEIQPLHAWWRDELMGRHL